MIQSLHLVNFKNFREATLELGKLTLLVGTNASGKSNLRDAFRFLHGIGRGYRLAEILGEKWGPGGDLQWKGIRGGPREIAYEGSHAFALKSRLGLKSEYFVHDIEINVGDAVAGPKVVHESFLWKTNHGYEADESVNRRRPGNAMLRVRYDGYPERLALPSDQPVLTQLAHHPHLKKTDTWAGVISKAIEEFASMRFFDLAPDAMRMPSVPGQKVLGDRGENLSSVLSAMCEDPDAKRAALEWTKQLTSMDVEDFEFVEDQTGRILVTLVESGGQRTSAYSASEGALRFLGILAALRGPTVSRFYFFEDLETAIHPTRLYLLLELIERHVKTGMQVVATTHSPQLLGYLSQESMESAALVYRLPGQVEGHIRRIRDFPDAPRLLRRENASQLLATGWLENASVFLEDEEAKE